MKRKTMKARLSLALISLIASTSALAGSGGTDDIFGSWTYLQLTGNFNKDFRWFLMESTRTRDDEHLINPNAGFSPRVSQELIWGSIGYNLSEHTSIWLGYSHYWNKNLNGTHNSISRPYQDFLWTDHIGGGFTATLRSRMQELFTVSGAGATGADPGNIGVQLRQLASISHAIPGIPSLSAYLSDEGWFNLNNSGPGGKAGFNQNWAMGGVSYQATSHLNLSLGYLGQYLRPQNSGHALFTHNVQFGIRYNF
jgi:hypothetical protein